MNHKWENNICVNCGVNRERKTRSLLMAISEFPPYNHYKHEWLWFYWYPENNTVVGFNRPDCKQIKPHDIV